MCKIYSVLPKNNSHQLVYDCVNLQVCYNNHINLHQNYSFCVKFFILSLRTPRMKEENGWWLCVKKDKKKFKSRKNDILMKCNVK